MAICCLRIVELRLVCTRQQLRVRWVGSASTHSPSPPQLAKAFPAPPLSSCSVAAYKVPPPGEDAEHCMELRAACCATSLFAAAQVAKELNDVCGLFVAPKNEQMLSQRYRERRQLYMRSLKLVQRVSAPFKVSMCCCCAVVSQASGCTRLQGLPCACCMVHLLQTGCAHQACPLALCAAADSTVCLFIPCAAAGRGAWPGH